MDIFRLRELATMAYLIATTLSSSQLRWTSFHRAYGTANGSNARIVCQHPRSSSALMCKWRSCRVKNPLVERVGCPAMVRVPPQPRVSVAASLWTLACNGRLSGTIGAPFRLHGSGPVHHRRASTARGVRQVRPVNPDARTALLSCCWTYNRWRRAPSPALNLS